MIATTILGNTRDPKWQNYLVDTLYLDWYELNKKILRKVTQNNIEVGVNLLQDKESLQDGDIISINQNQIIVINVKACECIAIKAKSQLELARICYEIGNRHAALFIDEYDSSILLLAMDKPIMQMLCKIGAKPEAVTARLIKPLGSIGHSNEHHH
jgi:urease accessory protein